ncbi:Uncharacterised protein [uncultured archaeon]|nr:Uncharacterised protein [uncultured archaeon]
MAYSYLKLPRCRICQHRDDKVVAEIDKDLLEQMPLADVLSKYSGHFAEKAFPLTPMALFSHRRHLQRAVPSALLQIPDLSVPQGSTESTSLVRSEGFDSFLGTVKKNREMLDLIVESATDDLSLSDEYLASSYSAKDRAMMLMARDKMRQSLAQFIELSKSLGVPEVSVNIKGTGDGADRITEFLVLFRQAADNILVDTSLKEALFTELAKLIRKSVTLRDIFESEKDK